MALKIIISASVLALVCGLAYLLVRYRRMRRECQEAQHVAQLVNDTNYRLACALYGQRAVDRAVRRAKEQGGN